ncbi:trehalose-phosphatase [Microlunatus sp. GCM10028923]|uniref:trehalose-phosphatase n=1 Tax=Microlunatus sp. GCM10028923 TaxID=3273400 RepID=UPI00360D10F7
MSAAGAVPDPGIDAMRAIMQWPDKTMIAVDFDGTLAPIVDDPDRAFGNPRAIAALGRLGGLGLTIAVITGRPARTVVRLGRFTSVPGLRNMIVLGQYGVERWDAATGEFSIPPEPDGIAALTDEVDQLLASLDLSEARLEHKGRAIGVHTRELPDPRAAFETLLPRLNDLAERHRWAIEPGKNVIEIRAPGMDKGVALRSLIEETGVRQVIFAGDDLGDLPAFRMVEHLRAEGFPGLLVCSASHEEDALTEISDLIVSGPDGVAEWLGRLADSLAARRS